MADKEDFLLESYDYELPESQIAQTPPEHRGDSRLMVINRNGDLGLEHHQFSELCDLLPEGALLVANNSRVLPARLRGVRPATGGRVEFLLLTPLPVVLKDAQETGDGGHTARAAGLMRCGGHLHAGETIPFGDDISIVLREKGDFGRWTVDLFWKGDLVGDYEAEGSIPLPPYIRRMPVADDSDRYQTVYAREDKIGSVAAPTAGLHFTPELMDTIRAKGVGIAEVTLHVGLGTFRPVQEDEITDHKMHSEWYSISEETAQRIRDTKAAGHRVIAVGTTSCRTLEAVAAKYGEIRACSGNTSIFLYPGVKFNCIDGLVTNFHLPESTLIMLIAALYGYDKTMHAYKVAVEEKYRFFSFGDAMLIL